MDNYSSRKYDVCRHWIKDKLDTGKTWEEVASLLVTSDLVKDELQRLKADELWPKALTVEQWIQFVAEYKATLIPITISNQQPVVAIAGGSPCHAYIEPSGEASCWQPLKQQFLSSMSERSVNETLKSCLWVLNHLSSDTRKYGVKKGLVTGSVQSGKTANMEGLVSMAADYEWNFFIILSGTIDSLRKQTRDRFKKDLKGSEGVSWHVLDFTGEDKNLPEKSLKLNNSTNKHFSARYLTVCLKNKTRLENLIKWLYDDPNTCRKLRVIIIDDEADQASVNTSEIVYESEQNRCAINQLIVNLANGKQYDGSTPVVPLQAINYISYTATPYANVLNESSDESLYPRDFICTLEESYEYFGAKVIFGNNEENNPGFNIVRTIPSNEEKSLTPKKYSDVIPQEMGRSIAWFLCASAVLRLRGHKKSISMLIHTTAIQQMHFRVYDALKLWLSHKESIIELCRMVYQQEANAISKEDLREANANYSLIDSVIEYTPNLDQLITEIEQLLSDISNIALDSDKTLSYTKGLHLCVDNCKANKEAEDGTYLRIVYPNDEQLAAMAKAPVFLVVGGNTLSRGLTIEGLVCTYFSRSSNQADTLMQMARWFGYRKGYELLQRIWMTSAAQQKFKAITKVDMDMKTEVRRFMDHGLSPADFGPRIRNIPEIAKFRITAKNKSQSAEYEDFDFCGDSYETTEFENDNSLAINDTLTTTFVKDYLSLYHARQSTTAKAYVFEGIPFQTIWTQYLDKYQFFGPSMLKTNLGYFRDWMDHMIEEHKFENWNVAFVDGDNKEQYWSILPEIALGKIERTMKTGRDYIDIGSLRSGRDAICDVDEASLNQEQKKILNEIKKSGVDIIAKRSLLGLEDTPLLLIYRIKKDGGKPRTGSKARKALNAVNDIIGISIIVSGESIGGNHAKSLRVRKPE